MTRFPGWQPDWPLGRDKFSGDLWASGGVDSGTGDAVFDYQTDFLQLKEVVMESLGVNRGKTAGEKIE